MRSLWVAVEVLTLGNLHKLFTFTDVKTKRLIANTYRCKNLEKFESWLYTLVYLRNLVAHNNRFFRYKINRTPKKSTLFFPWTRYIFDLIVVLRELYPEIHKDIWNTHLVDVLKQRSNIINLADYGFPTDWEDILRF